MVRYVVSGLVAVVVLLGFLGACRDEEYLPLSMGIARSYRVSRLELLSVRGALTEGDYVWRLLEGGGHSYADSVVSTERDFRRVHADTGTYQYECVYTEGGAVMRIPFEVRVETEFTVYSPYAVDVLEYVPAPGPDVNRLLRLTPENTPDEVLFRCRDAICGPKEGALSLGAFGGYVVLAFDHLILDKRGQDDLLLFNNVQIAGYEGKDGELVLANSNPGVVHVGYDRNGNGRPDADEWYEIRGSEHEAEGTLGDYAITYFRPQVEGPGGLVDSMGEARRFDRVEYIAWRDNQGGSGYIPHLKDEHFSSYWPAGVHSGVDSITFRGRRLPSNAEEVVRVTPDGDGAFLTSVTVRRWVFAHGYANNWPDSHARGIDIADAVDREGRPVVLPGVEYVRIHTGSPPTAIGRIAVQATEVAGAVDLHMLAQ